MEEERKKGRKLGRMQARPRARKDGSRKEKKNKREEQKRPCKMASYLNTRLSILPALAFCRCEILTNSAVALLIIPISSLRRS